METRKSREGLGGWVGGGHARSAYVLPRISNLFGCVGQVLIDSSKTKWMCWHFPTTGVFAFGLFATDIFVNAGQVVTGSLAPYFLTVCQPNYTGTECRLNHQFISNGNICTGNRVVVERARRSFPSKDASLSVYSAVYVTVRISRFLLVACGSLVILLFIAQCYWILKSVSSEGFD